MRYYEFNENGIVNWLFFFGKLLLIGFVHLLSIGFFRASKATFLTHRDNFYQTF